LELLRPYCIESISKNLSQVPDEVSVAAKLFIAENFKIKPPFDKNASSLLSENHAAQNLKFSESLESAKIINKWISENTEGKIEELVKPESLNSLTRMIIASAIVFKGKWKKPFGEPFDGAFGSDRKPVEYISSNEKGHFRCSVSDEISICSIPYQKENLWMTLLMPSGSLSDFEKNLTSSKLEELLSRPRLARGPTNITIPKFKIACETNLKDQLSKLGFGDLFDESKKHNYASLTDEDIFLSDAIHSATIEVDEVGTIATAATVLRMQARCAVFPMIIEFNKPFLFVLQLDEMILFLGRFESPS